MTSTVTVTARGANWIHYTARAVIASLGGLPPEESTANGTSSPSIPGSLFLPPDALGELRQGQVIDQDAQLHTICTVGFIGRDPGGREIMVISEQGDTFQSDMVYDRTTGLAVAISRTQQVGMGQIEYSLELVGQE
jgi:hypothetical protein